VLCQPVAGVAPLIGCFCQIESCLNSFVRCFAGAYWGLIKDGEFQAFCQWLEFELENYDYRILNADRIYLT